MMKLVVLENEHQAGAAQRERKISLIVKYGRSERNGKRLEGMVSCFVRRMMKDYREMNWLNAQSAAKFDYEVKEVSDVVVERLLGGERGIFCRRESAPRDDCGSKEIFTVVELGK